MKKILLMGNPNVGKSVVFSRLTGVQVISANYPGTTVEFTRGYMMLGGEKIEVIDVPGTYTLQPTCRAEEVACEMLNEATKSALQEASVIINVVDATNLERNLYLTLELMEQEIPVVVALNIWDDAKHQGIHINVDKLAAWLGVPVVPIVGLTGEGFVKLIAETYRSRTPKVRPHNREERWADIGKLIAEIQHIEHRHHTFWEWLQDRTIHPWTGLPIALLMAYLSFKVIRLIGEGLITYLADPFFETIWRPLLTWLSVLLGGGGIVHDLLIGKLINGQIDFVQSFGVLSTAVYIEFAMVLPYLIAFYLLLGVLEDSGYLPRVAVLLDGLLHKLGLHGFAIVPTFLGLGCNVPGIMATRIFEDKRERFITSTLISIGVPCAALQAMIIGILGAHGGRAIATVYLALALTWVVLGMLLNRLVPGFSPELLIEIPPYRLPPWRLMLRKLWWRVKGFLKEALPVIMVGVLVVNLLYLIGLFEMIVNFAAPVLVGVWGLPKEALTAIVIGFLRKDVAVGMLVPLNLTVKQLIVACTVLAMSFPCIATFVVLWKELGWQDLVKASVIMIVSALLVGGLMNIIL